MYLISSIEEFSVILNRNEAVLAYFSTENCSICKVLKPKVAQLVSEYFPKIKTIYISSDHFPELAAQLRIFNAPTVVVFFEGHETIRRSRAFGLDELKAEIHRPYSLLFE